MENALSKIFVDKACPIQVHTKMQLFGGLFAVRARNSTINDEW